MAPKVLAVTGPTATGKTRLGVELALRHNGEVVSADSMQVYRRMNVGTAKPSPEEMCGVPHHMIDVAEPWEAYSVARYVTEATAKMDDILSRNKLPILVGGTGLYLDSLLSGRTFAPHFPEGDCRARLCRRAAREGNGALYAELQRVDPQSAKHLHPNDAKRIIRALEVFYETGETIWVYNQKTKRLPPRYDALRIALSFSDRAHLKARIGQRVDKMMENGLFKEVSALLLEGLSPQCTAMQAIGYKEMAVAVTGSVSPLAAAEDIKLRSRQYAKRQLTWLRKNPSIRWILWDAEPNFQLALHDSTKYMKEFGLL
ncbi:MAG: tRNA (adenosine(37)-N6)-dimethylallyltransferase MiaA [Oscillospiraceae bacterium]|nr:tRNA (adenosine(37)-N6)-dimethylallyltransferase MiaA [Oscillospiraceae bacterium]